MNNCERLISASMFSALASLDLPCAQAFATNYAEPADQTVRGQIIGANRYWRMQLGMSNVSTTSVRECLQDNIDLADWLRLFAAEVAPVAVGLSLPIGQAPQSMVG